MNPDPCPSPPNPSRPPRACWRRRPALQTPLAYAGVGILCAAGSFGARAGDFLASLDQRLFLESKDGFYRADVSGALDLEGYYVDQQPPGLLFLDDRFQFQPRLSMFLDLRAGKHLYALVQGRADRGFDPGAVPDGDARLDEYLVRYTPFDGPALNLQAGKFATVFGSWVQRHDSWQNPFITAPLPYENVVTISDHSAPLGPAGFLARRDQADKRGLWLPPLWGPAYTTGASLFGAINQWDYALEFKNASISSRPYAWDPAHVGWDDPTVSGRLGFRPNAAWTLGGSFSHGAYLLPEARPSLPAGRGPSDFPQTTLGADVRFSWRHWDLGAEAIATRFEVPRVGDADTLAYYLEAKYKFTPKLYGALRWNQQLFDRVPDGAGGTELWDRDILRSEAVLGYRWTRHMQTKLQYSFNHQSGPYQQGQHLVGVQMTFKF